MNNIDWIGVCDGVSGLLGRFLDTPQPRTPPDTLLDTPIFRDSFRHPPDSSGLRPRRLLQGVGDVSKYRLILRTLFPLTALKNAPNPKICPKFVLAIVFGGSGQGEWHFSKICQNWKTFIFGHILTNFWQIPVPLIGTSKNCFNHWDRFWTMGFGAFLHAVRGKRVCKTPAS